MMKPASPTTTPGGTGARGVVSAIGARLTRALSRDGASSRSISSISTSDETAVVTLAGVGVDSVSPSRGRDLVSTGRGGVGNIHRSQSRDLPGSPPPHGREASPSKERITHVGRGGIGNFRDPLKPHEIGIDPTEVVHEHDIIERHDDSPHRFSTGRGGAGNIKSPTPENSTSRSRSRGATQDQGAGAERSVSRGRQSVLRSTGRGGAGNITADPLQEEEADELERRAHSPSRPGEAHLHSTGRGGLANVTPLVSPPVEHTHHEGEAPGDGAVVSTGRGGAGNIHERRSVSRGGAPRSPSGGRGHEPAEHHQGPIGKLMERVRGRHSERGQGIEEGVDTLQSVPALRDAK